MSTTGDICVDLGSSLFMDLAEVFIMTMESHGITGRDEQTLVYAGFLSTVSGQMCAVIGPENTQAVLESVKQAASKTMRSTLKAVKV
ncbi:MAG: hypothetical protein Q7T99_16525 [Pseudomonas sp.]|nr:hypothetical protein [Pseudomonas sp.]